MHIFMHNAKSMRETNESSWDPLYTAPARQSHIGDKAEQTP